MKIYLAPLEGITGYTYRRALYQCFGGFDKYFIPFIPIAQIYLGKTFGFKPKNDFQHQTINIIVANAIGAAVFTTLKYTVKEERPDQSDYLSFPSGHTSIAFTNAALLYYEYKDSNVLYASSGFLFATATGVLRAIAIEEVIVTSDKDTELISILTTPKSMLLPF